VALTPFGRRDNGKQRERERETPSLTDFSSSSSSAIVSVLSSFPSSLLSLPSSFPLSNGERRRRGRRRREKEKGREKGERERERRRRRGGMLFFVHPKRCSTLALFQSQIAKRLAEPIGFGRETHKERERERKRERGEEVSHLPLRLFLRAFFFLLSLSSLLRLSPFWDGCGREDKREQRSKGERGRQRGTRRERRGEKKRKRRRGEEKKRCFLYTSKDVLHLPFSKAETAGDTSGGNKRKGNRTTQEHT